MWPETTMAPGQRKTGGGVSGKKLKGKKPVSRKERRKRERVAKKQKKVLYHSKQGQASLTSQEVVKNIVKASKERATPLKKSSPGSSSSGKKAEYVPADRKLQLAKANEREKKEIARLEKLLKVGKKKDKMPKSFQEDGLDYLLDLTDQDSSKWDLSDEEDEIEDMEQNHQSGESDSEPEELPMRGGYVGVASRPLPSSDSAGKSILSTSRVKSGTKKKVNFNLEGLDHKSESEGEEGGKKGGREVKGGGREVAKGRKEGRTKRGKAEEEELLELDDSFFNLESDESDDGWEEGGVAAEWEASEEEEEDSEEGEEEEDDEEGEEDEESKEEEEDEEEGQGEEDEEEEEKEEEEEEKEEEEEDDEEEKEEDEDVDEGEEEEEEERMEEEGNTSSDGYLDSEEEEEDISDHVVSTKGVRGDQAAGTDRTADLAATYVPPHLRNTGKVERLKKKVQGLLNRLSESNMKSISAQVEQLYRENSRNDMNVTLWDVLCKACVGPVLITDRFALEQTMLVALLHHHVGTEVGAHVVQNLVMKLVPLLEAEHQQESKEMDCLVLLLAHLYNYRVIHCLLIYDLVRKLVATFSERDVELLLLLLKNTGLEIRRDDAKSLKDIILQIQSKAADSSQSKTPRMKFMLETISALRTNNARKIPNFDPSLLEHMKKLLRGLLRSSGSLDEAQLKVSLQDLLNVDSQGRWWVVGSAWTGRDTNNTSNSGPAANLTPDSQSWVLDLARKQRMNTDIRKKVFSVLMTSEDYVDGFQKLVRLGLKDVQEREVVHVLVDCCLQEKTYNPYYAYLAQKLCEFKKANQVTFQYSLWDRFKSLDSLTSTNRTNLRHLCVHLITQKALSLAILKVIEFTELDKVSIKFFKRLLHSLLSEPSEAVVRDVFTRVAPLPHLKRLRDSLLVFLTHYVWVGEREGERGAREVVNQRIKMVELALRTDKPLL